MWYEAGPNTGLYISSHGPRLFVPVLASVPTECTAPQMLSCAMLHIRCIPYVRQINHLKTNLCTGMTIAHP